MKDKIIFLDIDGVLNSLRNVVAQGGFPFPNETEDQRHLESNLDPLAIGMIKKLCLDFSCDVVLHSSWRTVVDPVDFGKRIGLSIVDKTSSDFSKPQSIAIYLEEHPEIKHWLVLDDDDMGVGTKQIRTTLDDGFVYRHFRKALKIMKTWSNLS